MRRSRVGQTDIYASEIGFGGSIFSNYYGDSSFGTDEKSLEASTELVREALALGINYFDTAPWYINSEYILGIALENVNVPRSSYYLATKVGRYNIDKPETEWFDFSYNRVIESVENSLRLLNTDYLDLVQIHDFEYLADDYTILINETLPALDFLRRNGLIRYIGINSYIIEKLRKLLEISPVKIDTVSTFCHLSLIDVSLARYTDYFRSKGVGIINSAPLAMGLITRKGAPAWNRASEKVKQAVKQAFEYCDSRNVDLVKLAVHFAARTEKADVLLMSFSSVEYLKKDINALNDLSQTESQVLREVLKKFFEPLSYEGYGETDVKKYLQKLRLLKGKA